MCNKRFQAVEFLIAADKIQHFYRQQLTVQILVKIEQIDLYAKLRFAFDARSVALLVALAGCRSDAPSGASQSGAIAPASAASTIATVA